MSWASELEQTTAVYPHFVLSGNTRDLTITRGPDGSVRPVTLVGRLRAAAEGLGYDYLVVADPVSGIRSLVLGDPDSERRRLPEAVASLPSFEAGPLLPGEPAALDELSDVLVAVTGAGVDFAVGCLVVVDAGRFIVDPRRLSEDEHHLFTVAASTTGRTVLRESRTGARTFPTVVWICEQELELPTWYLADDRVHSLAVPSPDLEDRRLLAHALFDSEELPDGLADTLADELAGATDAMSVHAVLAASRIAERVPGAMTKAASLVRLGVVDDPWGRADLVERLARDRSVLARRVKGQPAATAAAWVAITRNLTGFGDAFRPSNPNRPRATLLLVGPTGTGKTELCKALAEMVFQDAEALIRIDMSSYSQPQSDQRLFGAPPGYVGFEQGGELTNAVRRRPFSVILFDEWEKAHPDIWKHFLQIIDEGHVDDGLGRRVYFRQTVIVFTSNLGVTRRVQRDDGSATTVELVDPTMPFEDVDRSVRAAVEDHIKHDVGMPELLGRVGKENIVVFDFIRPETAREICGGLIVRLVAAVGEARGWELELKPDALEAICAHACDDLRLGGRDVANRLESTLLNPLSAWAFDHLGSGYRTVTVTEFTVAGGPVFEGRS